MGRITIIRSVNLVGFDRCAHKGLSCVPITSRRDVLPKLIRRLGSGGSRFKAGLEDTLTETGDDGTARQEHYWDRGDQGEGQTFRVFKPSCGQQPEPLFCEASEINIAHSFVLADSGFDVYRQKSAGERAAFLENIAAQIISLDDELLERASAETGLLTKRLTGERSHCPLLLLRCPRHY